MLGYKGSVVDIGMEQARLCGLNFKILASVYCIALVVRLFNLVLIPDIGVHAMVEDSPMYWHGAATWVEAGYFSRAVENGFVHETERVPLYFLFLIPFQLVFGDSVLPVLLGQTFLDSGTCIIIARLGSMIDRYTGLISGLLAAVWPNLIIHSALILTDTLFVFLFSLVLLFAAKFLTRGQLVYAGLAGLICGFAIMTRPVAQFLPFAMAVMALYVVSKHGGNWMSRILAALIILATAVAPTLPILSRNINEFGVFHLTNMAGTHTQGWVVGYAQAIDKGTSFSSNSKILNEEFADILASENIDPESLTPFEESSRRTTFAKEKLMEMPASVLVRAWFHGVIINIAAPALLVDPRIRAFNSKSFIETLGFTTVERVINFIVNNDSRYIFWIIFGLSVGVIALALQIWGWLLVCRWKPIWAMFSTSTILYFLLINGPVASPKYRLPFEPILIIFQAIAIIGITSYAFRLSRK